MTVGSSLFTYVARQQKALNYLNAKKLRAFIFIPSQAF
jgi:hypothetical protein